jgi:hypothetical protein
VRTRDLLGCVAGKKYLRTSSLVQLEYHLLYSIVLCRLLRYFVLVRSDYTLRRYKNAEDVESKKPSKDARIYKLSDVEYIAPDLPPRFYMRLKSRKADAEGEAVKFTAETDVERLQWIREIDNLLKTMPREDDEDDAYRECI